MTQGLPPLPDLGSGLEVGERLPSPLSFGVFRQWLVNRFGEAAAESITPDNFQDHGLYLFFKASTTPLAPPSGAGGALTQFDPTAPRPFDPTAPPPNT